MFEFDNLTPEEKSFFIYTDGACFPNPGIGGWGWVAYRNCQIFKQASGGEVNSTNNRMEIIAARNALLAMPAKSTIIIHTDSRYVKDGITTWVHGWQKKGWKNKKGDPVKNRELWESLIEAQALHLKVQWKWVKGHSGIIGNEIADKLAGDGVIANGGCPYVYGSR